jgi:AraC-like DNA-binding protein
MQSGAKRALFEHIKHDRDLGILFRDVTAKALQYPWHFHPELELTHIVRGSGRRHVGDSVEPFEDGDLCLVGSNAPHCWLTEHGQEREVHARVIQFAPESMAQGLGHSATFRPLVRLFERAGRGLQIFGSTHSRVASAMRELFTERTRPLDRFVGLLSVLSELSESSECRQLALLDASGPLDAEAARTAGRLLAFIHEHATDSELSFTQVARAVGMSRASLGRAFPRLFGRTYAKYLAEVRVVKACSMLSETDKSMAEIAIETGFGSVSNFNRRFLALKQTSPLRYRKTAAVRHGASA